MTMVNNSFVQKSEKSADRLAREIVAGQKRLFKQKPFKVDKKRK